MSNDPTREEVELGRVADLDESLYNLNAEERAFFKQQTGIESDDELKQHILAVQREAYTICPYPCIRHFYFTNLQLARLPVYDRVLALGRTRPDPILLDIGCCFGNDVRKAVADGFPRAGCVASDLRPEFWALGHALFCSTPASFSVPFVPGDALTHALLPSAAPFTEAPKGPPPTPSELMRSASLAPLYGRVSALHASSFFHLFDEAQQADLAARLAPLLSPEPGSMLLGQHVGLTRKGFRKSLGDRLMFCHDPDSWRALWESVYGPGKVKVEAHILKREDAEAQRMAQEEGIETWWQMLVWNVTRV